MLGNFVFSWLSSVKIYFLEKKNLSGTLSVSNDLDSYQDLLLILIWVQTVCKDYQQMTKVAASMERENGGGGGLNRSAARVSKGIEAD